MSRLIAVRGDQTLADLQCSAWSPAVERRTIPHEEVVGMCWSSDWEEQELLRDEAQRAEDERRDLEAARERETEVPERRPEDERELVRV